jgi:hypothetical protein
MRTIKLEEILEALKKDTTYIMFTKLDGSVRSMQATLDPQFLPDASKAEDDQKKLIEANKEGKLSAIAVWDMGNQDWRSFRLSNLSYFGDDEVTFKS